MNYFNFWVRGPRGKAKPGARVANTFRRKTIAHGSQGKENMIKNNLVSLLEYNKEFLSLLESHPIYRPKSWNPGSPRKTRICLKSPRAAEEERTTHSEGPARFAAPSKAARKDVGQKASFVGRKTAGFKAKVKSLTQNTWAWKVFPSRRQENPFWKHVDFLEFKRKITPDFARFTLEFYDFGQKVVFVRKKFWMAWFEKVWKLPSLFA